MSNFNTELNIAKEASLIASKILISNKEKFNKVLSDEGRDIKLKADLESESAIKNILRLIQSIQSLVKNLEQIWN